MQQTNKKPSIYCWKVFYFNNYTALFPPNNEIYREKLDKVLTRTDCNSITDSGILKDLASKGFTLQNTLIVDDNHTTFVNNPLNALYIPRYNPEFTKESLMYDDRNLLNLIEWIQNNSVNTCPDVRLLDKNNVFK